MHGGGDQARLRRRPHSRDSTAPRTRKVESQVAAHSGMFSRAAVVVCAPELAHARATPALVATASRYNMLLMIRNQKSRVERNLKLRAALGERIG